MLQIKIINKSNNKLPEYATEGSSGLDLRAYISQDIVLEPMQRFLVPTGLYVEIPLGYEIQVRPRSGLAVQNGITCLNSPGTVDSDYRGEIKVLLVNLSSQNCSIKTGDRIAQMVLAKVEKAILVSANQLQETSRGEGGFGHTGKN